ncbi:unnamed protein product [Penicillium salamii]|uniref:Xylanolytic transcriptional activator regulatory domain-containing protein n=1 Tax=Penicillium salamii TaxID=1612424 RepID=A0A9W4IPT8_9EURO|nr:unnamed protein product [Penicillium salamii]CAG8067452.1 unnamed protein product [Penicillium salamii]CAG8262793.1 unnamed protein product [Penicillium salamii]CAG8315823.1 unnamed protein product [Penicillium salamii]CAG8323413.1 unnamed protein product [Penicillium salamii]
MRLVWLAPSSMWSFTTRLSILMSETLHYKYPESAPTLVEKEVYPLRWDHCATKDRPDITGLPSLDYALYLFDTVKFHLGQSYRFFDEEKFLQNVHEFYHGDPLSMASEQRLWFIQYLLVLSFGSAFLCRTKSDDPPGSYFFVRAMSLMPDHASLWKNSLLAIEVLALAALYLYSIDQRESAYIYLGQAMRIAQYEGLHTQLSEEQLGTDVVARCRNLWWTLYIMDRHFSYSVGLPMSAQDSDITTPIEPCTTSHRDVALSLQVKLSHLLSTILTSESCLSIYSHATNPLTVEAAVYKAEKTQVNVFLDATRSILQRLAGHAQEVEGIIHATFRNSVDSMPRGTRHITLLYHQCVIVATRPLLLSALMERLLKLSGNSWDVGDTLDLTKTLITTGIKSASKTLRILSHSDSLLEVFLLYNLEFTYAAAIHLAMANALFPEALNGQASVNEAHAILDQMIANGNKIAMVRKDELAYVENLFLEVAARAESNGLQPLSLSTAVDEESGPAHNIRSAIEGEKIMNQKSVDELLSGDLLHPEYPPSPCTADFPMPSTELLDDIGISSAEFLAIVDQIGNPENSYSVLDLRNEHGIF